MLASNIDVLWGVQAHRLALKPIRKEFSRMTYDERKMCNTYVSLIGVAEGIQHIYKVGGYELLSDGARRKLSNAEAEIQEVMNETYKYVSQHTKEEN